MERIPCNPSPSCKYAGRCYEDIDHIYWPADDYRTPIEKEFRQLEENKRRICRVLHELRHATEAPPEKPSRDEMLLAINGIRRAS